MNHSEAPRRRREGEGSDKVTRNRSDSAREKLQLTQIKLNTAVCEFQHQRLCVGIIHIVLWFASSGVQSRERNTQMLV